MANISITGLGTGMDTKSIVSALVEAQSAPLTRLTKQMSLVKTQKTTLTTLASQLTALASKADAFKNPFNLRSSTATTSDASAVTVAVGSAARAGSFDVSVSTLAAAHRSYSNGFTARDQAGLMGEGTITLQSGSTSTSIDVTSSMTLDDVAAAIDNLEGIDASVVYDGSQYRLQISGTKTGAANAITLSESGTSMGLADGANLRQAAVDAQFTIDGIAMTRSTNLVDDAFAGVSLSLNKVTTTTPATIKVTADNTALTTKLNDMVTAYNAVVKSINAQASVVGADNSGKLTGDGTLAALQRALQGMFSTSVGSGPFKSFAELGIATQRDGTITLDATKLNAALASNRDGVANLLSSNPSTGFVGLGEQLAKVAHQYGDTTGVLPTRVTQMDSRIRAMTTQASQMQARIDAYEQQLNQKFASMESTVNGWKASSNSISNAFKTNSST